ncbi:hypothetical protein [Halomonas dongshanensis]|nr:hypothetical protein [Halomonas dongshanensis]
MPPYLTECSQDGIVEYAASVCQSIDLGVIYYNRANGYLNVDAVKSLADRCVRATAISSVRRCATFSFPSSRCATPRQAMR